MSIKFKSKLLVTSLALSAFFAVTVNAGPYHEVKLDKVLASQPEKTKSSQNLPSWMKRTN